MLGLEIPRTLDFKEEMAGTIRLDVHASEHETKGNRHK